MIDNDERRTVSALIWGDANVSEEIDITEATDRLIAYFRRTGVPEPSTDRIEKAVHLALAQHGHRFSLNAADERDLGAIIVSTINSTPEPQGEPSDAQVEAASEAFWKCADETGGNGDAMRAALRAAGNSR